MTAKFKTIAGPLSRTLKLTDVCAADLETWRGTLSEELGFLVTASQTLAWILRHCSTASARFPVFPFPTTVTTSDDETPEASAVGPHVEADEIHTSFAEQQLSTEVKALLQQGKKILAIKLVRERVTPMPSLMEAKTYVESLETHYGNNGNHTAQRNT